METDNRFNDYELLYMIYQMDENSLQELLEKYERDCDICLHRYLFRREVEYAYDDLYIEAIQLIYQAVYTYRDNCGTTFGTFFHSILLNHILNYMRKQMTYQGMCLRKELSLDCCVADHKDPLINYLPNQDPTLEGSYFLVEEGWNIELRAAMKYMKQWEQNVISLRLIGYTYEEVAQELDVDVRQVEYVLAKLRNQKPLIDYKQSL